MIYRLMFIRERSVRDLLVECGTGGTYLWFWFVKKGTKQELISQAERSMMQYMIINEGHTSVQPCNAAILYEALAWVERWNCNNWLV